jgi:hypothetical protein
MELSRLYRRAFIPVDVSGGFLLPIGETFPAGG